MPKISVIIPVYNAEKYIKKCIESVLSQSFSDFELLLVDDGSTDQSGEICDSYAKTDKRIKVIHKQNGGVSTARNAGLLNSSGEYIGFIDSDDYIEPEMYSVLIDNIEKFQCDISICGFKVFNEDMNRVERVQNSGKIEILSQEELVLKETDMPWSIRLDVINKLFRKKSLNGLLFDETLKCAEDTLFLHQAIRGMKKGVFVELPLYVNVRHEGSTMRGKLNANSYYRSYEVDYLIYLDIKKEYPQLADRSYLVLLNNCIWKLEDVCQNLKGRVTDQEKEIIKKMRRFTFKIGVRVWKCKEIGLKQKIGLFLLTSNLRDRNLHFV